MWTRPASLSQENSMTRIRPIAGAVLATLMTFPSLALAAPVLDLTPPDGGLTDTKPVDAEFVGQLSGGSGSDGGGDGDSSDSSGWPAQVDTQPTLQTRHFGAQAQLDCKVAGTPNDLVVINASAEPLPSGTRIKWQLKGAGKSGFFALLTELPSGESLIADDVVAGDADTGANCVARVI